MREKLIKITQLDRNLKQIYCPMFSMYLWIVRKVIC